MNNNLFTKRHYKSIAYILGISNDLNDLEKNIIKMFKSDNINFKEEYFIKAINRSRGVTNE